MQTTKCREIYLPLVSLSFNDLVMTEFFAFRSRLQSDFEHYSLKLVQEAKLLQKSAWWVLNCLKTAYIDYYMSSLQMQKALISIMYLIRLLHRNSMSHKVKILENMQSSEWFLFFKRNSHLGVMRTAKFSNLSSITLFIPASQGAENTRIYYVGFLGSWMEVRQNYVCVICRRFSSLSA